MGFVGRVLSLGDTGALPDRLARHVRVSNALALFGVLLCVSSAPFDSIGASLPVAIVDVAMAALYGACLLLNARGRHTLARVTLMVASNVSVLGGVLQFGADAEIRTIFFPLALIPFFVFSVTERGWLVVFVAIPVASYFLIGAYVPLADVLAVKVYEVYAPVLAFFMLIAGSAVFAFVQHRADDRLAHTRARAAHAAQLAALGEMSSGIAHEIRNPLAAIHIAASQLAEHPGDAAQVAQLSERIQRIVMRASRIIESLRTFSRDGTNDPFVSTPVERIIGDTIELCGKRFADTGVSLIVEPVAAEHRVECRSVQLSQVLMNLLGNSYDVVAGIDKPWVRIATRADGDSIEIAVSNNGPPVPVDMRARIFEPFFTTKAPDRGTGLGLSLSRGIVEGHRGTLTLDATSEHTRFVMRMPLVQPREA